MGFFIGLSLVASASAKEKCCTPTSLVKRASPGALVHEESSGESAAPRHAQRRWQRAVIGHDDHVDFKPFQLGSLCGKPKVEPIARVIFDDQKTSGRSGDVSNGRENRGDGGAREDIAAHRRVEHAFADEPGVGGLVPGPTACVTSEKGISACLAFWKKKTKKTNNERETQDLRRTTALQLVQQNRRVLTGDDRHLGLIELRAHHHLDVRKPV